jgi:hypothetical protein
MTQKSFARQQRDSAEKAAKIATQAKEQQRQQMLKEIKSGNNTCWDDLNNIHSDCQALLLKHVYVGREMNDKELIAEVDDKASLVLKINTLANDLRQLKGELAQIHAQHAGKTGGVNDPDVLMTTFAIFEQYTLFQERHDSVVMPTVYHILEQFEAAEKKLIAKKTAEKQKADETNPAVISDVEFKEVDPKAH